MVRKPLSPGKARKDDLVRRQREDIIAAASAEFAVNGFSGAQIGVIATAAEVSLTTLYSMFQSKDALYSEVVLKACFAIKEGVFHKMEHIKSPARQLIAFVEALLSSYEKNRDFMRLYVHATQGFPYRIRPELGDEALELFQSITAWLVATAEEARSRGEIYSELDPEAVAYTIMGSIVTTCSQWVERNEPRPLYEAAPALRLVLERTLGLAEGKGGTKRRAAASGGKSMK